MTGVCPAGLARTGLPAARAAAVWPTNIASGKFHGAMQAKGPRARQSMVLVSPVVLARLSGSAKYLRACKA